MLRRDKASPPREMQLYTVDDVAELLDVSKKLVYTWVSGGALPAKRLGPGRRLIRISRADLRRFIDRDFTEE